jgi:hypothetical protein
MGDDIRWAARVRSWCRSNDAVLLLLWLNTGIVLRGNRSRLTYLKHPRL